MHGIVIVIVVVIVVTEDTRWDIFYPVSRVFNGQYSKCILNCPLDSFHNAHSR
jgi:hypothetical protein